MTSGQESLAQYIRNIPLFSLVDEADLKDVLRLFRSVELTAGEILFSEGQPGKAMWVLGPQTEVSLTRAQALQRPVAVAYAKQHDVVGEMALIDDGPRSATAMVTQSGTAYQIDANEFHAMRATFVPAAFKVLRKMCIDLCARLRRTNERIVPSSPSGIYTPPQPVGPHPDAALVDRYPAFRDLPATVKLALAQKLEVISLSELAPLFAEGERSDGAYFIVKGEVSVGRNGKTLAHLHDGEMFGAVACIDSGPRSASCVATGPATLLKMSARDFDVLFASGHRFAFRLIDMLARQLVQHVREANRLLPTAGRTPPARSETPPEFNIPLELELELDFSDVLTDIG